MKMYFVVFIIIAGISGCGISKQLEKGVNDGLKSVLEPRIAVSKFLAESTASIFEFDSVGQGTSVFIRSLNTHFYNTKHSFDLNLDSITVKIIRDTIVFSKISFPLHNQYILSDTIDARVTCNYKVLDSLVDHEGRCLLGNYTIYRDSVVKRNKFIFCP